MLKNMSALIYFLTLIPSLCFLISPSISQLSFTPAPVPGSIPFHYINRGNFDVNIGEFESAFRCVGIHSPKFSLCFYTNINILNSFTLGIGMSYPPKWVWSPNRNNPVRDGASLSLGKDGNLVLADDDGRVVWQTNTANNGVIGFKLLDNGNLVLYDANNNFVWQSFDYPSDTLLAGQSLKAGLTNKLVSNASPSSYFEGNYTLEMSPNNVSLYYKSSNNPTPLPYYS
ncbi:epidermis-specific secreted glycoprotein EP1-like [Spinacia oleracea]|uniref:Epidermis-specific secreted glycoprotein EP1-like n=1 Tax=Spinacia oleracea TaxID=3562 RepID=A0ABM3RTE2_SPIOL|nr:epidermis-specific secreted glycoprotein EP1-like [Spinacia oleracea]